MKRNRKPNYEQLESRQLLNGDCGYHNSSIPEDVDGNNVVAPLDALLVISRLNKQRHKELCADPLEGESKVLIDVNNSGWVEPHDALLVIAKLNANRRNAAVVNISAASNGTHAAALNAAESLGTQNLLTSGDVEKLLKRASQVSSSQDAIIAVVDRSGQILGVRVEAGVSPNLTSDPQKLAFAIDGAVAKARTAAFFANNEAPLTSRTIRFISQSTITQREVESSPFSADPRYQGPGLVAPIGVGGHFPPEIPFAPQVDLFAIEHQSRDSQLLNGLDGIRGNGDDQELVKRFNVDPANIPALAQKFFETWPESYGRVTNTARNLQARGVATLPGGVPLYKVVTDGVGTVQQRPGKTLPLPDINLVGGIGVFFPGEEGYATYEQGFVHASQRGNQPQTEASRTNAPRVLEAEAIAIAAAAGGGLVGQRAFTRDLSDINAKLEPLPNFVLPSGRLDLVGITLEVFGPTPTAHSPIPGLDRILQVARSHGPMGFSSGEDRVVNTNGDKHLSGQSVPEGWLVAPHDSSDGKLTAAQVEQMILNGVKQADVTRAAIRLNIDGGFRPGARTKMVLSVADTNGEVLGIYRMPDATIFSIDVSVAKARNTAYYADAQDLQDADRIDFNSDELFGAVTTSLVGGDTVPRGTALTNRTFRFLSEPRYPTGNNLNLADAAGVVNDATRDLAAQRPDTSKKIAPFSSLQLPGIHPLTAENLDNSNPLNFSIYADPNSSSPLAFDSFVPSRNFRDPGDAGVVIKGKTINGLPVEYPLANQNGIVFFPGSTPLYVGASQLAGGLGVSGDGVDQDDVVTSFAQVGFAAPDAIRVDQFSVGSVRLPFARFNRNPNGA